MDERMEKRRMRRRRDREHMVTWEADIGGRHGLREQILIRDEQQTDAKQRRSETERKHMESRMKNQITAVLVILSLLLTSIACVAALCDSTCTQCVMQENRVDVYVGRTM